MTLPAVSLHRTPGAGVLNPINLGSYATWAAIAVYSVAKYPAGGAAGLPLLVGLGSLGAFLLLYLARALVDDREGPLSLRRQLILAQLGCALVACWGMEQNDFVPALLVIVAGQLGLVYARQQVATLLLAADFMLALLLTQQHDSLMGLVLLLAWCGFQAFAAVGAMFAVRLQALGLTAVRINAELMATRQLLDEGARADERLRLSRELHDVAGHKLTALKMQLALHRRELWRRSPALEESLRLADELLTDIRGVVSALRAEEGVDLPGALRALDPGLPRPRVAFEIEPGLRIADMRSADALLRCAQEAMTNVLRHSGAWTVRLRLGFEPAGLVLEVEDDGRGWQGARPEGNGIRGMRERLAGVGGELELRRGGSGGLWLRAILPGLERPAGLPAEAGAPLFQPAQFCIVRKRLHADDRAGG
ncbi:sensor histidine kinase [Solimonas sp. K1W22B-7]|uniref:sensor histidine kinase n=1 Tax=Solimonas sp. K1W22B-7 TaxID=2303331 RepID=UPI000E32FB9F|nr:histidine kinase [Solimonas sp. K1W22B-7]AXQ27245.1 sensor histidine kinase [Solimonas sp. K1W22B-7]